MELKKIVLKNGEKVNEFHTGGEQAQIELINLLLDKTKKRYGYGVKISTDNIDNSIHGTLTYNHNLYDGRVDKYVYEYYFKNVENNIDLR